MRRIKKLRIHLQKFVRLIFSIAMILFANTVRCAAFLYPDPPCDQMDAILCVPVIEHNRVEWWDRNYLLPGIHYAHSKDGYIRGLELSYFRAIGLGGVGSFVATDQTPAGQQVGWGIEVFLTYFGFDYAWTSSAWSFHENNHRQFRPMISIGWISLYYKPGNESQFGALVKLPVSFDKGIGALMNSYDKRSQFWFPAKKYR